MKLTVFGCSGAEMPGYRPPGFLIDESWMLDAGTVTSVLDEDAQKRIRNIFVTHAHLDHVRSIPALADNLILGERTGVVRLYGIRPVLDTMRHHLMNDDLWPDFTRIPSVGEPVMSYVEMEEDLWMDVDGIRIKAVPVSHSVAAAGCVLEKDGRVILYTGDTGPTMDIWNSVQRVHAALIEVSFPDRMEEMAIKTGHLTPSLLALELQKMADTPEQILVTHMKPQYRDELMGELISLGLPGLTVMRDDDVFEV